MKVTYNWLKSLVDFDYSPEELVHILTMLGLEVDAVVDNSLDFDGVIVGQVKSKNAHERSDKLWICEVDIGDRNLSVVCGAPNVEVGQKVPVAPANTRLPNGTTIQKTSIRGVESEGMICSELELGVSSRGDGIMVLNSDVQKGQKLKDVLGAGEITIDIDVTPNRPDCFGVIGIAREISAVSGNPLRKPKIKLQESGSDITEMVQVRIHDAEKCPRYSTRYLEDVGVGSSPWWLAHRLEAVGIRSINNIVDVTNYVMMETGQPLHAFDYDLLKGRQINVKTAKEGERFATLDDKVHTLNSECLMICDGKEAVAIGGVMGGQNSEVSSGTKRVLLECAHFDPVNIRRTAKFLGMSTEASKRFERGVDPNGTLYALDRAAQMIAEIAGGTVAKGYVDAYPKPIEPILLRLRNERLQLLVGKVIPAETAKSNLNKLGFGIVSENKAGFDIEVPTFRPDVTREADLIEEVARLYGYDNIEPDTTAIIEQLVPRDSRQLAEKQIIEYLLAAGVSQIVSYCMISRGQAKLFTAEERLVALVNPISEDMASLRPSLMPGLLNVIRWNINRKNNNLKLFEIGKVFSRDKKNVIEKERLTVLLTGQIEPGSWRGRPREIDIFDVKGLAAELLSRNFAADCEFVRAEESDETDVCVQSLAIKHQNQLIGYIGETEKTLLQEFDIEQPVFVLDLDFEALLRLRRRQKTLIAVPKFPAVSRDIAVVVDAGFESEKILNTIKANGGEHLQKVELFDVYTGDQIGDNERSLAYNLTFYSMSRTLTEEEVDTQLQAILKALSAKFNARLRQ